MSEKSDRIKELLANPYLEEAFQNVHDRYMRMLETAPVNNTEDNLVLILDIKKQLQALKDVKQDLQNSVRDGDFEDLRAQEQSFLGDLHGKAN